VSSPTRALARPGTPGFGDCARCTFAATGSVATCAACALATLGRIPAAEGRVGGADSTGPSPVELLAEPRFDHVWAATTYGPQFAHALYRYKVAGHRGWARVFARLLLARLAGLGARARAYDLIVATPTFVGPGGREFDHVATVLDWARRIAPGAWPIEPAAIVKTAPSPALKSCRGWLRRIEVARTELRATLQVPEPERVVGRAVLVFDDVLTTGATCNAVAGRLLDAGATRTAVIVLARQPLHGGRYPPPAVNRSAERPPPRRSRARPRAADSTTEDRPPAAPAA
jgi:predicted amidophosphoribosyltransferase